MQKGQRGWASQGIASFICAIIGKEALGFDVKLRCSSFGLNAAARIANAFVDAIVEWRVDVYRPNIYNTHFIVWSEQGA